MRSRIVSTAFCLTLGTAVTAFAGGCRLNTTDIEENFETECGELGQGSAAVATANIDGNVKAYVSAVSELKVLGEGIRGDVKAACINIATDLGEADRWSNDDGDGAISNAEKTGACDVASARIEAIMTAGATASANFALEITGGQCEIAVDVQEQCEQTCKTDETCTEATVEQRCDPAQLVVECSAECKAEATCQGRVDRAANCMGKCQSECVGKCAGDCNGVTTGGCEGSCEGKCDGAKTPAGGDAECAGTCEGKCTKCAAEANCQGKCASSCNGTCKGECKLDPGANVSCGASIKCKGGCTGTFTEPKCESELVPPVCTGDTTCQTSCSAQGSAKARCNAATVTLRADLEATADIAKLKATIETNLPVLILTATTKGQLTSRALDKVTAAADAAVDFSTRLDTKTIACAKAAADTASKTKTTTTIAVQASVSVSASCTGQAG
jgi:hypothetical protein